MIYSKSKKFLFCHVPKTGGTSFSSSFLNYVSPFQQSKFSKLCRRFPFAERTYRFYDFTNRPHTTAIGPKDYLVKNSILCSVLQ